MVVIVIACKIVIGDIWTWGVYISALSCARCYPDCMCIIVSCLCVSLSSVIWHLSLSFVIEWFSLSLDVHIKSFIIRYYECDHCHLAIWSSGHFVVGHLSYVICYLSLSLSLWLVMNWWLMLFNCLEQNEVMALTAPHGDTIESPDQRFYGYLHVVPMLVVSWIALL